MVTHPMRFNRNSFFRNSQGATAVEVAILLPIFLFLVFAVIEFGLYSWQKVAAENAINSVARLAVGEENNARTNINTLMEQQSFGLIDFTRPNNCVCARVFNTLAAAVAAPNLEDCGGCGPINNVGGADQFVVYEILYRHEFITPLAALITSSIGVGNSDMGNELPYYTSTIVRNE